MRRTGSPWHYLWIGFELGLPFPKRFGTCFSSPRRKAVFLHAAGSLPDRREGGLLCGKSGSSWPCFSPAPSRNARPRPGLCQRGKNLFGDRIYAGHFHLRAVAAVSILTAAISAASSGGRPENPPQQYLTGFRLEKGAELMREHGQTPSEAAISTDIPMCSVFPGCSNGISGVSPQNI